MLLKQRRAQSAFIEKAWKWVSINHPYSICGCSLTEFTMTWKPETHGQWILHQMSQITDVELITGIDTGAIKATD